MPPVPVLSSGIEIRDVPLFFEAIGVIKPSHLAEVRPQVSGIIKAIHFNEGDWVEEGELLYSIEEAPYAIRVQEMRAHLTQNQVQLSHARKKLERYQSLSNKDLIAKVEWDNLEAQVALYEAQTLADEARLASAQFDLEHCQIYAPISGRTGKSSLQVGNIANSTPLVSIANTKNLLVDFSLTEQELQKISSTHADVALFLIGGSEKVAEGKLSFLDHTLDPRSGLLSARADLTTAFKPLCPGQSIRVHLFFGQKESAQLIPLKAVKTNQLGPYVFSIKEGGTVEILSIKLGPEHQGFVVVEEGLENAQRVVTQGHLRLFPGSKVIEATQ
jgi:multidrug efflux system membrane fusion protein